jgi:hypothetical protein
MVVDLAKNRRFCSELGPGTRNSMERLPPAFWSVADRGPVDGSAFPS